MKLFPSAFYHYCLTKLQPVKPLMPTKTAAYHHHPRRKKDKKIVVIMGATGTGKSRLSIDLASRYLLGSAEVINSDKMQVYKGLDITTNKITMQERNNVVHHLLGTVDPLNNVFTPSQFRSTAAQAINDILSRSKVPLIVGGSNSFIHALLVKQFDENDKERDPFDGSSLVSSELRYKCCFIWVDVALTVLDGYLCKRVDEMLDSGMFDELSEFYRLTLGDSVARPGLTKAIGVPEFRRFFEGRDCVREGVYEEAVREIKGNTCQLAKRQIGKIEKFIEAGWDLHRVDATAAFKAVVEGQNREEFWERDVVQPSVRIVRSFLDE